LTILLSVLRFTNPDYPFGTFKLFLSNKNQLIKCFDINLCLFIAGDNVKITYINLLTLSLHLINSHDNIRYFHWTPS